MQSPEQDGTEVTRKLSGFAIGDYSAIVSELVSLGYRSVGLEELVPDQPLMFLRHDVDLSLEPAVRIAEVERSLGLRASYYILISTHMYNPASAESRRAMGRILAAGHEIGLHFDATQFSGGKEALEEAAEAECRILEELTGAPVRSISFHRPAPELLGQSGLFAGRLHTYEPRFFGEIGYISDSSGGWFRGHPLDHAAVQARSAIQLLTHPIWWRSPTPTSAEDEIEALRAEREAAIGRGLAAATANAKALRP